MAKKTIKPKKLSRGAHVGIRGLSKCIEQVEKAGIRSDLPEFSPGDTVRVHVRIKEGEKERIQVFEGVVIARSHSGASRSFNVRKISHGVGVERIFLESSPKVAKLEVAQKGRVRRAKLYYLRGLEGKAARIEREVETLASAAASAAAKEATASAKGKEATASAKKDKSST